MQTKEFMPAKKTLIQNRRIEHECNSQTQVDVKSTNVCEDTRMESNKNKTENYIPKNLTQQNQSTVDERQNSVLNENSNKNEFPSCSVANEDPKDKSVPFPFLKLTNPQTKSLLEIRFPEKHSTFKSSITVNSCSSRDEIKLSYDRDERTVVHSAESKSSIFAGEETLQKNPKGIVQEITPQISVQNAQNATENNLGPNLHPNQMFSPTFMEYLELKIRDILNNFQKSTASSHDREIQTNNNDFDFFTSHKSPNGIQTSSFLPPYQSDSSLKYSVPNSTVPSEKMSETKGAVTDLEVPKLILNLFKESSDSNFNSNTSRTEDLQSTVEENFFEERKYENDDANFVNFKRLSESLPEESTDILNVKRLLPLPQTVINEEIDHENNSQASSSRRKQITTKLAEDNTSIPSKQEENIAETQEVNSLIMKSLLPLPSDLLPGIYSNSQIASDDRLSNSDISSRNVTSNFNLSQLEAASDHGLPTELLPAPSVLNTIIHEVQESPLPQNFQDCCEDESIIPSQNLQIRYYNSVSNIYFSTYGLYIFSCVS